MPKSCPAGTFCGRCDQPIRPGEPFEARDILSPSSAGTTVYLHKNLCVKTPFQAAPQLRS
ncbi:hypothetical protein AB0C88_37485 [Streptomyces chartreusis]|uniref:hypothetical protein n=1 Tax=Streptomyces chartreusis TaxID=1969 RepID=UPI0033D757F6